MTHGATHPIPFTRCECCGAVTRHCIDCGQELDFPWFDGRCSKCGDAKYWRTRSWKQGEVSE